MGFWERFCSVKDSPGPLLIDQIDQVPDQADLPEGLSWTVPGPEQWTSLIQGHYGSIWYPTEVLGYWFGLDQVVTVGIQKNNELIGTVSGKIGPVWVDQVCHKSFNIDFLCVREDCRRQGLAGKLIEEITRYAKLNQIWIGLHTTQIKYKDQVGIGNKQTYWRSSVTRGKVQKSLEFVRVYQVPDITGPEHVNDYVIVEQLSLPGPLPDRIRAYEIRKSKKHDGYLVFFDLMIKPEMIPTFYVYVMLTSDPKNVLTWVQDQAWKENKKGVQASLYRSEVPDRNWKSMGNVSWLGLYNWNSKTLKKKKKGEALFWTY